MQKVAQDDVALVEHTESIEQEITHGEDEWVNAAAKYGDEVHKLRHDDWGPRLCGVLKE